MQNDKSNTPKNKPIPDSERPDWAKSLSAHEWKKYVHSPQCKVCNAEHNGRILRTEIEAMVIERKTHVEICNILFEKYKLTLAPHNISRHMSRHAPSYARMLNKLLENDLGEVLRGAHGQVIDAAKFLLFVIQMSLHNAILNPEQITISDGIRAAEKLNAIVKDLNIPLAEGAVTQGEINTLLDVMQTVMTPEQRKEVKRRWGLFSAELAPEETDEEQLMVADGECIPVD